MNKTKILFALITFAAFILVFTAGFYLKTHAGELSRGASIAWGAIFVASSLTFVRGIRYLGNK